jgi:phosphohistidine phosphatase
MMEGRMDRPSTFLRRDGIEHLKQLLVMRHAKAERPEAELDDRNRLLAPRGDKSARAMGKVLRRAEAVPERILSSPALRARHTAELVATTCRLERNVELSEEIYDATAEALVSVVRSMAEPAARVLLVGHNPGMEHLVWSLCGAPPADPAWAGLRLATGAIALVELDVDRWSHTQPGCGHIEWSLPPALALAIDAEL